MNGVSEESFLYPSIIITMLLLLLLQLQGSFPGSDVPGSDAVDALSIQVIGRLNDFVNIDEAEFFT